MYRGQMTTSEVLKEREQRHRRLMKLIKHYKRSSDENKKLERIKVNTVMEINLRFLRSEHNRYYRFPKDNVQESSQQETYSPFQHKQALTYDLKTQNQVTKVQPQPNILSLDNSSRRIKSLDREKTEIEENRLGRLHQIKDRQQSYKKLRKNSLSLKKKVNSHIKLPELNKRQKLKTESKNDSLEINKVVGKKLMTETPAHESKEGVHKYIKNLQERKNRKKLNNLFNNKHN